MDGPYSIYWAFCHTNQSKSDLIDHILSLGDIWSTSNFKLGRSNINTLTKSSLYTNEVMDAAVRCMLDTVERFNQRVPPRPLNYNNANVKVNYLICDITVD